MKSLVIKDCNANIGDREILKGLNLEVEAGKIHAIMGPTARAKARSPR